MTLSLSWKPELTLEKGEKEIGLVCCSQPTGLSTVTLPAWTQLSARASSSQPALPP